MMVHLWRLKFSSEWLLCAAALLGCAFLFGGCGGDKREAGKNGGNGQGGAEPAHQSHSQSDAIEKEAELAAQQLTSKLVRAKPLYRVMLALSDSAGGFAPLQPQVTPLPVADFHARIVVVEPSPQVESLSMLERAQARAEAFGLEWRERNYTEIIHMLHSKSPKNGCSTSRPTMFHSSSPNLVSSMKTSGHRGAGEEPYSTEFNYLGSRAGKDHYLLSLEVEENIPLEQAEREPGEAPATPSTPVLFAHTKMTPDLQEARYKFDAQDPFAQIKIETFTDGRIKATRTRRITYELVYGGEPFYLKLADRVLLCFGGHGIERYTAEELAAMKGKRSSERYRPCPNCALSEAMAVDEVRVKVGEFAAF